MNDKIKNREKPLESSNLPGVNHCDKELCVFSTFPITLGGRYFSDKENYAQK